MNYYRTPHSSRLVKTIRSIRPRFDWQCVVALGASLIFTASASSGASVVFADFENGTWGAWIVKGKAFGEAPAIGSQDPRTKLQGVRALKGWVGQGFANSWPKSDAATGKLISPKFKIEKPIITFLIGGGNYQGHQCINLVVDGNTVRTATGKNSDHMTKMSWDVSDLKGKTAHIEIVDEPL